MAAPDVVRIPQIDRLLFPGRDRFRCVRAFSDATLAHDHPLKKVSHVFLQVQKSVLPDEKFLSVSISNGPKEKKTMEIESTNTGREMLLKVLKLKPEHIEDLYLVCNGKTVPLNQKLCDLQLKLQVTFIVCQKCHGG